MGGMGQTIWPSKLLVLMLAAYPVLCASALAHYFRREQAKHTVPPLLFASKGCSESTAIQEVARAMLTAHGIHIDQLDYEELRPDKNSEMKRSGSSNMSMSVKKQIADAQHRGKAFFNKLGFNYDEADMATRKVLVDQGARIVNVWRSNVLDKMLCDIRDCFPDNPGYPVLEDGSSSTLCFERRTAPPKVKTLAFVNTTASSSSGGNNLEWRLTYDSLNALHQERQLLKEGFTDFLTVSSEELMAFEYSAQDLRRSVQAWSVFLLSLGITPNEHRITSVLKGGCSICKVGSRERKPHTQTIYNFEDVKAVMEKSSFNQALLPLLRE